MNNHPHAFRGFLRLGEYLQNIDLNQPAYAPLQSVLVQAKQSNGWFTHENCLNALDAWGKCLQSDALAKWWEPYEATSATPKTIGLVLAGNIPLVGFHDVLSVLAAGHNANVKLSSSDPYLIPFLVNLLEQFDTATFSNRVQFTQELLGDFDAVIATGSNNAARYFNHYFGYVPHLIRQNRNGIAVLSGNETEEELNGLATDMVAYYGLGCRSTSKVYVPKDYDFNAIFGALYPYAHLMDSAKYANNYDYNKAVFLMSEFELLDNGFYLFLENDHFSSPIACLHYSYYNSIEELQKTLDGQVDQIQCISSHLPLKNALAFGQAQQPALWDYADGVDTVEFLLSL